MELPSILVTNVRMEVHGYEVASLIITILIGSAFIASQEGQCGGLNWQTFGRLRLESLGMALTR